MFYVSLDTNTGLNFYLSSKCRPSATASAARGSPLPPPFGYATAHANDTMQVSYIQFSIRGYSILLRPSIC